MKRIYVAGPIGAVAGRAERVREAIAAGEQLWRAGFHPFVPHLFVQWGDIFEHHYEEWMALDEAWLRACEAVWRMPGASPGADREVALAERLGMPVFRELAPLQRWARDGKTTAKPDPVIAQLDAGAQKVEQRIAAFRMLLDRCDQTVIEGTRTALLAKPPTAENLTCLRLAERALARLREVVRR